MDLSRSVDLGHDNYLPRVHREVLYHVIDRSDHRRLASLNHDRTLEVFRAQSSQDGICLAQNHFQIVEQGRSVPSLFLREFTGSITADRLPTDAAENPLGDVAGQMNQQVADAVRSIVGPRPCSSGRQRVGAVAQLDGILFRQPVARARKKNLGSRHYAVRASAATKVSRKTSSASSTFPKGADT